MTQPRSTARILGGVAVAALLTACAPTSPLGDPTGVDQLTIPTPSPDQDDFVAEIDHPWMPLTPGRTWTYATTLDTDRATTTVRVAETSEPVDGVATTPVVTRTRLPDRQVEVTTDFYTQDDAGNVWWFGHEGPDIRWRAGAAGAEAGLAMPAEPRLGDGFESYAVPGEPTQVTTVAAVGERIVLERGTAPVQTGSALVTDVYERGRGLVEHLDARDSRRDVLVEEDAPSG